MSVDRHQTQAELRAHLAEQREFIDASIDGFDAGRASEAKRLAVACRILFHDTANSHSLLGQLGVLDDLALPNTGRPFPPWRVNGPEPGKVTLSIGVFQRISTMEMRAEGGVHSARFKPKLDEIDLATWDPFETWWGTPVLSAPGDEFPGPPRETTRCAIVLGLSNKDGGAHVDPDPGLAWWFATRASSFGQVQPSTDGTQVTMTYSVPMGPTARDRMQADAVAGLGGEIVTPVHAAMRTIADEVRRALDAVD